MATVNVSSWAEFKAAIAVSGDTVVLPEGAVWDLNELEPLGITGLTAQCAVINGNGTEIKNMWTSGAITANAVNDLKLTNIVGRNGSGTRLIYIGASVWERCTVTGILESGYTGLLQGNGSGELHFCAMHVDFSAAAGIALTDGVHMTACRYTADAPNATEISETTGNCGCTNCEFVINTQCSGTIRATPWAGCTLRGAMPNVSMIYALGNPGVSIYCTDDAPNASPFGQITGVTGAQMKDAAYLQSIGFTVRHQTGVSVWAG